MGLLMKETVLILRNRWVLLRKIGFPSVKKGLAWREIFRAFYGLLIKIFMCQTIL